MATATGFIPLLLVTVALAGCVDGSKAPVVSSQSDPLGASEAPQSKDLGTLKGHVVSDQETPIAKARIELGTTGRWTLTGPGGDFLFQLVPPGPYEVVARVGNLTPVRQTALVKAGEETHVEMHVVVDAVVGGVVYHYTTISRGFVGCSIGGSTCPGYSNPNEKKWFDQFFNGKPEAILYEVVWQRFAPDPVADWQIGVFTTADRGLTFSDPTEPPYMRAVLKGFTGDVNSLKETQLRVRVDAFAGGFLRPEGIGYEQAFDLYITTFYVSDLANTSCAAPPEYCPEGTQPAT